MANSSLLAVALLKSAVAGKRPDSESQQLGNKTERKGQGAKEKIKRAKLDPTIPTEKTSEEGEETGEGGPSKSTGADLSVEDQEGSRPSSRGPRHGRSRGRGRGRGRAAVTKSENLTGERKARSTSASASILLN